jgi:hypothetical protein
MQQKSLTFSKKISTVPSKIHDKDDSSNIGVLYWNQKALDQLTKNSGPLAKSNEYQVHYWALVARIKFSDNSIIDIAFPTCVFNYKQQVSASHIDFELKDVEETSKAFEPVHNVVVNKLLPQLEEVFSTLRVTIEYKQVPLNTMHRHPNGVSSFSGTDLKKDHVKNTGIVFPLKSANETPSFSSIIYNNPVRLIHTEYRIATGDTDNQEGINYKKGKAVTYIKDDISTISEAEQFFGKQPVDQSYIVSKETEFDSFIIDEYLSTIDYEIDTRFVKEENVEKKTYTSTKSFPKNKTKKTQDLVVVYTDEDKTAVKKALKLELKDLADFSKMSYQKIKEHALQLERYYYSDETIGLEEYKELPRKDIVELIMELQDNILTEFNGEDEEDEDIIEWLNSTHENQGFFDFEDLQEEPAYLTNSIALDIKKQALLEAGAKRHMLETASTTVINKWYDELINNS